MNFFLSQKMLYCRILLTQENVWETLNTLGKFNCVQ